MSLIRIALPNARASRRFLISSEIGGSPKLQHGWPVVMHEAIEIPLSVETKADQERREKGNANKGMLR